MATVKPRWRIWFGAVVILVLGGGLFGCRTINHPPVAVFWHVPESPTAGEQTTFNASASYDPDAAQGTGIEAYQWSFGDGSTGDGASVSHVYAAGGEYAVSLTVVDSLAATATATETITVVAVVPPNPPIAQFTYTPASPKVGDVVAFSAAESQDPASLGPRSIVAYQWQFGDGSTAQGSSVQHVYSHSGAFLVALEVTDDDGGHDTTYATVHVSDPSSTNSPPVAQFSFSPSSPYVNQNVTFSADTSYDPARIGPKDIVLYSWEFGDGDTAVGETTVHKYSAPGSYEVRLTVSDDRGASDTETKGVQVLDVVIPPPPPPPGG